MRKGKGTESSWCLKTEVILQITITIMMELKKDFDNILYL